MASVPAYYLQAEKNKPNVQVEGKKGWNWTTPEPSFFLQPAPPTPEVPLEKSRLTPRAPSCAKRSPTSVSSWGRANGLCDGAGGLIRLTV